MVQPFSSLPALIFRRHAFTIGSALVLVATALGGRGLDIPNVEHVINYDLPVGPEAMDEYVNRCGRTGRIGNVGKATSFFTNRDLDIASNLVSILKESGQTPPEFLLAHAGTEVEGEDEQASNSSSGVSLKLGDDDASDRQPLLHPGFGELKSGFDSSSSDDDASSDEEQTFHMAPAGFDGADDGAEEYFRDLAANSSTPVQGRSSASTPSFIQRVAKKASGCFRRKDSPASDVELRTMSRQPQKVGGGYNYFPEPPASYQKQLNPRKRKRDAIKNWFRRTKKKLSRTKKVTAENISSPVVVVRDGKLYGMSGDPEARAKMHESLVSLHDAQRMQANKRKRVSTVAEEMGEASREALTPEHGSDATAVEAEVHADVDEITPAP